MQTPSFGIYANQNDKRWNTFIEEMNERFNHNRDGRIEHIHYGIDNDNSWTNWFSEDKFQTIITLGDYFAEGSVYRVLPEKEKPTFKRGERILVWDNFESQSIHINGYLYDETLAYPVLGIMDSGAITSFKHWKPLPKENPERQKLQQEIEQLEKELNVKREKLSEYGKGN